MDDVVTEGDVGQHERALHLPDERNDASPTAGGDVPPVSLREPVPDAPDRSAVLIEESQEHAGGAEGPAELAQRRLQHRIHVERAMERAAGPVQQGQAGREPYGLAGTGAALGVQPRLLERHRKLLAEEHEWLDAGGRDRPPAAFVVGKRQPDHPIPDDEGRQEKARGPEVRVTPVGGIERRDLAQILIPEHGDGPARLEDLQEGPDGRRQGQHRGRRGPFFSERRDHVEALPVRRP
jgi:hypothetical protein